MLRSRKNAGKYHTNCYYGCCPDFPSNKAERRYFKRKENAEWKREAQKEKNENLRDL
jgi:hypothetical protein